MSTAATALLIALLSALGWALYDLFRRFLTARMTAWTLVVWITLPALPLIAAWGVVANDWRVGGGYLIPGLGSVLLNVVANFLYFRAFQLSPLSATMPMLSLTPVFAATFGLVVLGEPIAPRAMIGIACVVLGAFRLALGSERKVAWRVEPGSLLMAAVALCWSATLLLDKLALRHASPSTHSLVLYAGVALGGLIALGARGRLSELRAVRGSAGLLAITIAIGVGALGSQLFAIRIADIGLIETLKRGVGSLLAVVWGRAFSEPVSAGTWLAVAFLVAGLALMLL